MPAPCASAGRYYIGLWFPADFSCCIVVACAASGKGGPPPRHFFHDACRSPARRAARGGRAPCTPGLGRCPWEPRFDVSPVERLAHMLTGRPKLENINVCFGTTEACADSLIALLTSIAGGLGGGSPSQRGARGAEPTRMRGAQMSFSGEREGGGPRIRFDGQGVYNLGMPRCGKR